MLCSFSGNILGQSDSDIAVLKNALKNQMDSLGENDPDPATANACADLAKAYFKLGRHDKSIEFFEISLLILENHYDYGENHIKVADLRAQLGWVYYLIGNYEKAIDLGEKALEIRLKKLGPEDLDVASSYNSLGIIYSEVGNYEKAIYLGEKALEIRLEKLGPEHLDVASSYNSLGVSYREEGNYEKAIDFGEKALEIQLKKPDMNHPDVATTYSNLQVSYYKAGNYGKSIDAGWKALRIRFKMLGKEHLDVATSYSNLGKIYNKTGNYEDAIKLYSKALEIQLKKLGMNHPDVATSYSNLAFTFEKNGNYRQADSLWHIIIPRSIERLKDTYLFLPEEQRIKYLKKNRVIYNYFYSFAVTHGNETTRELATDFLLNTKCLSLDYGVNTNKIIEEIDDKALDKLSIKLNVISMQITKGEVMTVEELENKGWDLKKMRIEQDNITTQILQNPKLKAKLNSETIAWKDIQNRLQTNETTLDFVRIYEREDSLAVYYAVLIRKDLSTPQFIRIADEKILLSCLVRDGGNRLNDIENKKLYEQVWMPLAPYLKNINTIHLSPTGRLHNLAFDAFQGQDKRYLADRYKFHYYSAMRDFIQEKSSKKPYKKVLLMGGILYDAHNKGGHVDTVGNRGTPGEINPLKWTLVEVKEINNICKKSEVSAILLTNDSPTEDTVRYYTGINAPDIYHISTHGEFLASSHSSDKDEINFIGIRDHLRAADNPLQRSALMLYGADHRWIKNERNIYTDDDDGILTALEITSLNLQNTDLVVLSACSTGLGDVDNTEGVFGLQRAFKLAGVKNVIVSLWDVDDAATKDLMVLFYQNLLEKKQDVATALRNAKTQLREEDMESVNWAGFILIE